MPEPVLSSPPRTIRKKLGGRRLCAHFNSDRRRLAGLDKVLTKTQRSGQHSCHRRHSSPPPRVHPQALLCHLSAPSSPRMTFKRWRTVQEACGPELGSPVSLAGLSGEEPRSWLALSPGRAAPTPRLLSPSTLILSPLDLNPGSILSSESPRGTAPLRSAAAGGP